MSLGKLHKPSSIGTKYAGKQLLCNMYVDHSCRLAASFILKCSWFISTVNGICHSANIKHEARWIERRHSASNTFLATALLPHTDSDKSQHLSMAETILRWYSCWIRTRSWLGSIFGWKCAAFVLKPWCVLYFSIWACLLLFKTEFYNDITIIPTTRTSTLLHCYT